MSLGIIGSAAGLFVVTNIDDIVVLALFFARAAGHRGAGLLPAGVIPWLGLVPLALGLRAGWEAWLHRPGDDEDGFSSEPPGLWSVTAVTFANGGDNIGVYVPVFVTAGTGGMSVYVVVFLVLLAPLIAAGHWFATRPAIATALSRWGHVLLPIVLVALGILILVQPSP